MAIAQRMEAWSRSLADDGWRERAERLESEQGLSAGDDEVPPAFRTPVATRSPRPLSEVTEDVLRLYDNWDTFAAPPTPDTVLGTDRTGKLIMTLSSTGMTSCAVDERWVADQTSARLVNAFSEALATARDELARSTAAPEPAGTLDTLFGEAMALPRDQHGLVDRGDERG
ncbi:hypothetical protein LX15_000789 [Streptoalloteichus tenebrarius]|uniref:YbaB/EbfC DNA-binding family protein n=1 Tax=Streptoalloteichus tenebrarius (strain ATCC 17920 / DSM 40477 / JCM 4838 / CBS 697.72 / NBRC 16177 / NCIMB 11028 / NRRL B-12390 / A12253. 1 / ISP 5477) TaxID=1933 RepID=A0ABT1HNL5_STRSD|nr:hypothetical protein [Streptoalloteichus tenebrarius]MCP2257104.1 hypothetical protein [Streptoalloteichus tenebrarius]